MRLSTPPRIVILVVAYCLPVLFLVAIAYQAVRPFGYERVTQLDIGSRTDTDLAADIFLMPSRSVSSRQSDETGVTWRDLSPQGSAVLVIQPEAFSGEAEVSVAFASNQQLSIIPPSLEVDPNLITWDRNWLFPSGVPGDLVGNAPELDGVAWFDGTSYLELPDSAESYEREPFSVYARWTPRDIGQNFQQIVGHFNWELLQNAHDLEFRIGRMDDAAGPIFSVSYPVDPDFFGREHVALARYVPSDSGDGYIDLYVDSRFAGRTYIGSSTIFAAYNGTKNVTLGASKHGDAHPYQGSISEVRIASSLFPVPNNSGQAIFMTLPGELHVVSDRPAQLDALTVTVRKR